MRYDTIKSRSVNGEEFWSVIEMIHLLFGLSALTPALSIG